MDQQKMYIVNHCTYQGPFYTSDKIAFNDLNTAKRYIKALTSDEEGWVPCFGDRFEKRASTYPTKKRLADVKEYLLKRYSDEFTAVREFKRYKQKYIDEVYSITEILLPDLE